MALSRIFKNVLRETWADPDTAGLDGGTSVPITTDIILPNDGELDHVECYCYVDGVIGTPLVEDPVVTRDAATGQVKASVANTAGSGNSCAYTVDIRYNHSIEGC